MHSDPLPGPSSSILILAWQLSLPGIKVIMRFGYGDNMSGKSRKCMLDTVSVCKAHICFISTESNFEGPIIRINPHEIHINDPEYIDEVYAGSSKKRDKYRWMKRMTSERAARTLVTWLVANSFTKQNLSRLFSRFLMNSIAREGQP